MKKRLTKSRPMRRNPDPMRKKGFRRASLGEMAESLPLKRVKSNPKIRKTVHELLLHPKTRRLIEDMEVGKGDQLYRLPELKSAREAEELAERIKSGHDDLNEAVRHVRRLKKNRIKQKSTYKESHVDHHVNNVLMLPIGSLDMALDELEERKRKLK